MPNESSAGRRADLDVLLRRIADLEQRVQMLEAERLLARMAEGTVDTAPAPQLREDASREEIPDDVVAIISAAVAAFLGVRARVRQIKLSNGSDAWAQHGRASIMASHGLTVIRN